jgi:hypothetical protein
MLIKSSYLKSRLITKPNIGLSPHQLANITKIKKTYLLFGFILTIKSYKPCN